MRLIVQRSTQCPPRVSVQRALAWDAVSIAVPSFERNVLGMSKKNV